MNNQYPYAINNAQYIPSSVDGAEQTYQQLLECGDELAGLDNETFLRGWFAIHFLGLAPHPDDFELWPDELRIHVDEARMRHHHHEIDDDQLYCSDSQHQGLRLQRDGNLRCYATGTLGKLPPACHRPMRINHPLNYSKKCLVPKLWCRPSFHTF